MNELLEAKVERLCHLVESLLDRLGRSDGDGAPREPALKPAVDKLLNQMETDQILLRQRLEDDLTPLTDFATRKLRTLAIRRLGREIAEQAKFSANTAEIVQIEPERWKVIGRYEGIGAAGSPADRRWWMIVELAFGRLHCIDDNRNDCLA